MGTREGDAAGRTVQGRSRPASAYNGWFYSPAASQGVTTTVQSSGTHGLTGATIRANQGPRCLQDTARQRDHPSPTRKSASNPSPRLAKKGSTAEKSHTASTGTGRLAGRNVETNAAADAAARTTAMRRPGGGINEGAVGMEAVERMAAQRPRADSTKVDQRAGSGEAQTTRERWRPRSACSGWFCRALGTIWEVSIPSRAARSR